MSQGRKRLNGLPDDVVAERYDKLRKAVLSHAEGVAGAVAAFEAMEADDHDSGNGGWLHLVDRRQRRLLRHGGKELPLL